MIERAGSFAPLRDGGRLAYSVHGPQAAAPVLLLRPLGGAMSLWGSFAERLAAHFRVVAFDYRGVGDSSAAPLRVTTRSLAKDALAVLDHLAIDRAHVFGISLGGMAATMLAGDAPNRIDRLVLASTALRGRALLGRDVGQTLRFASCFARSPSQVEPCLVRHVLTPRFEQAQPAEFLRILTAVAQRPTPPFTLLKSVAAAAGHNAAEVAPQLHAPTLVLAGEEDHILGASIVRRLAEQIPESRYEALPGVGHDLTLEEPQGTADRVAEFFSASSR